jgi:hypothetical protein
LLMMIKLLGSWNFWFMTWANNCWLKKSCCEINGWFGWFISKLLVASVLLFIGIRSSIWSSFELSVNWCLEFLCDNLLIWCLFLWICFQYSNSPEFNTELEIGNNSAAEFDTKFNNIVELLTKSESTQRFL